MHDTAYHIGTLAMNIYADLRDASILEVGSQAINGSLREHILPTTKYVGVDIDEGEGVDLVVEPGKPLPIEDDSFDFVMATSVFEHDPCFWMTFLEMCRTAKDGGYIYVSAPSNGLVHRYPQDNWRFYPDSGKALAQWAVSQGQPVTLIESFIAERESDIWNDFVAVFRKGRITKALPKVFLHEHVGCSNVITWKSKEIINRRDEPEDLLLVRDSKARAEAAEVALAGANELAQNRLAELETLKVGLAEAEDQSRSRLAELEQLRGQLAAAQGARDELKLRESELRQRQEEIEQTRAELANVQARQRELVAQLGESAQRLEVESRLRHQAELTIASWKELHDRAEADRAQLAAAQTRLADERDELNGKLNETVEQLKLISKEHADAEDRLKDQAERLQRMSREHDELQRRFRKTETEFEKRQEQFSLQIRRAETERSAATTAAEAAEARLAERYRELATLTNLLRQQEQSKDRALEHLEWFGALHERLASHPRWWGLMPKSWQRQRQHRHLQQTGLFNGSDYLERYKDVADARMDPLDHYLRHGMREGRSRSA